MLAGEVQAIAEDELGDAATEAIPEEVRAFGLVLCVFLLLFAIAIVFSR